MIADCYSIFTLLSACACDLHIPIKSNYSSAVMTSNRFFKMAAISPHFLFWLSV